MSEQQQPTLPQYSPPAVNQEPKAATAEQSKRELQEAIKGSNEVLTSASTVLALFPDTMTVDRAKVTITKRTFFRVADIMSMRIEDVLNVVCTVGPVFGTVTIVSRVMNNDQSTTIGRFFRKDAKRLKRVTQGYVIALQRNIDCSALGTRELAKMLEQLGADNHPDV